MIGSGEQGASSLGSRVPQAAGSASATSLLEVDGLKVHFPILRGVVRQRRIGTVRAVDGVSFTLERGQTLGLVGESGSGKTTTGRAIMRLVKPTGGKVRLEGLDVSRMSDAEERRLRRTVQMVFQNPFASLNPRMTIGNIIADPLRVHSLGSEADRRKRVRELLLLVGIDPSLVNRYPHQFSGGQRQRIGVARALAVEPSLVVCDEPVSALDVSIQAQILNLLSDIQERLGPAYLVISHDLAVVRHISDRIAVMYLGRFVEIADRDVLYATPRHPYSAALLASVHIPNPRIERRRAHVVLRGDIPNPSAPPAGCRFHTRCWLFERLGRPSRCTSEDPELRPIAEKQLAACHFAEEVDAHRTDIDARAAGTAPVNPS